MCKPTDSPTQLQSIFDGAPLLHQILALAAWMFMQIPGIRSPTACPKEGFLPDEELSSGFFYWLNTILFYRWAQLFHAYEAVGVEKLPPKGEGCLLVSLHTTHNSDICTWGAMLCDQTGRAPRGLIHRRVYQFFPFVKYLGMVPGDRSTAVRMLKEGFLAACLPGGGEEAMTGHENAYKLHQRWEDRRGYAHVAKEAGVPVYPFFMQNAEEMRFNPVFWLGNRMRIGQACKKLQRLPVIGSAVKALAMLVWFTFSWTTAIPVPVKTTTIIGDPVYTEGKTVDEIAEETKTALQRLIDENQRHGHSYMPGLRSRLSAEDKLD